MAVISRTGDNREVELLPTPLNFTLYRGDSFDVTLNLRNSARASVDLAGYSGVAQIKDSTGNIIARPQVLVGGLTGDLRLLLIDTTAFPAGSFPYTLQVTAPDGRSRTIASGKITFVEGNK